MSDTLTLFGRPAKLPRTLPVVVEHERGVQAVSVPVQWQLDGDTGAFVVVPDWSPLVDRLNELDMLGPRTKPGHRPTDVPNKTLREAAEEVVDSGVLTWYEIAQRVGWFTRDGQGDTNRLRRALGSRKSDGRKQTHVNIETATKIAEAINKDPVELGF